MPKIVSAKPVAKLNSEAGYIEDMSIWIGRATPATIIMIKIFLLKGVFAIYKDEDMKIN
mgnify:CR=1 FL=1